MQDPRDGPRLSSLARSSTLRSRVTAMHSLGSGAFNVEVGLVRKRGKVLNRAATEVYVTQLRQITNGGRHPQPSYEPDSDASQSLQSTKRRQVGNRSSSQDELFDAVKSIQLQLGQVLEIRESKRQHVNKPLWTASRNTPQTSWRMSGGAVKRILQTGP